MIMIIIKNSSPPFRIFIVLIIGTTLRRGEDRDLLRRQDMLFMGMRPHAWD